jgi:hypothetical protein
MGLMDRPFQLTVATLLRKSAQRCGFKGKEKVPTIVREAKADYDLCFWHVAFGFPGTQNISTFGTDHPFIHFLLMEHGQLKWIQLNLSTSAEKHLNGFSFWLMGSTQILPILSRQCLCQQATARNNIQSGRKPHARMLSKALESSRASFHG